MQSPASPFLRLPRELRDKIYRAYVFTDGGYELNPETRKLRNVVTQTHDHGDRAINLSFMYTCRQVAHEMSGLALRTNLITFKSVTSTDLRVRAGRYLELMDALYTYAGLASGIAYRVCSERVRDQILVKYPWFGPYLDSALVERGDHTWFTTAFVTDFTIFSYRRARPGSWRHGSRIRVNSAVRAAMLYTLQLCLEHSDAHDAMAMQAQWEKFYTIISHLPPRIRQWPDWLDLTARHKHWSIPSQVDIDELHELLHLPKLCIYDCHVNNPKYPGTCHTLSAEVQHYCGGFEGIYRFSAAAAAIDFFESFPGTHRAARKVLIHEDRTAVPWSSCHGRGLVPYCKDNPWLRVERKVDLWWNLFLESKGFRPQYRFQVSDSINFIDTTLDDPILQPRPLVRTISQWVMEAAELKDMPPGSFRLTLDGGAAAPANLCSDIFQLWVQQSAAEQLGLALAMERGLPIAKRELRREFTWYSDHKENRKAPPSMYFETGVANFPEELDKIVSGTSVVKCLNFSPGFLPDVEDIVQARHDWNFAKWQAESLSACQPQHLTPVDPLPSLTDMLAQDHIDYERVYTNREETRELDRELANSPWPPS